MNSIKFNFNKKPNVILQVQNRTFLSVQKLLDSVKITPHCVHDGSFCLLYKGTVVDVFGFATYNQANLPLPSGKTNRTLTRPRATGLCKTLPFKQAWHDLEMDQVLPTKQCPFGGTMVCCPRSPESVLNSNYRHTYWTGLVVPYKLQCWLFPWTWIRELG